LQPCRDGGKFDEGKIVGRLSYRNEHAWLWRNTVPIFAEINEFRPQRRLHGYPMQISLGV
jgi:hypothetical protein